MNQGRYALGEYMNELRARGGKAFMPFITCGHPSLRSTGEIAAMLRDAGADCLELGIPFSDPVADGAVIQASSQAALERGASFSAALRLVERAARTGLRVIPMSYANTVLVHGLSRAARRLADAGAQGLIVPDLPLEESAVWRQALDPAGIALVLFAAPTTGRARLAAIGRMTRGFVYYVSLTGVTGERSRLPAGLAAHLGMVRRLTAAPVCVGFGVSTPAQAKAVARHADGVIVGSALVRRLGEWESGMGKRRAIARYVRDMARAVHGK